MVDSASYEFFLARRYLTRGTSHGLLEYSWKSFLKILFYLLFWPLIAVTSVFCRLRRLEEPAPNGATPSVTGRKALVYALYIVSVIGIAIRAVIAIHDALFNGARVRLSRPVLAILRGLYFILLFPFGAIVWNHFKTDHKDFAFLNTYITLGGVMVGVAALIIVLSVMNGFETTVRDRFIGFDAHIRLRTFHDRGIDDHHWAIDQIKDLDHIVGISPYIQEKGLIISRERKGEGVIVKGIDPATAGQVTRITENINYGELELGLAETEDGKRLPGIVLGYVLADRLVVGLGDKITLLSPAGISGIMGQIPPMKQFVVTGYFETGLFEFDNTIALISLDSAFQLFRRGGRVTGLEIKIDDMDLAPAVGRSIEETLGGYPYRTLTWFELHRNLFAWMQIEKWAMFVVLSLIIMVAAFNIISTLIMVVLEKTREIGILKSMGATSRGTMIIFMLEGLVTGAIGTLLGVLVGFTVCYIQQEYSILSLPSDIYIISALPVLMEVQDFVAIVIAAFLLCFLAAIYPAWHASKLDPVEAIRHE